MTIKKRIISVLKELNIWDAYRAVRRKISPNEYDKREDNLYAKRKLFYSQFVKPGTICFDVGANMGNRSAVFLELGAKVVAVEPQKNCSDHLRAKFKGRNLIVVPKGLSDKPGMEEMFISNTSTLSSFSKEWVENLGKSRFSDHKWNKKRQIAMTTLDLLIQEYGRPVFCKIDVEGYEFEVLKGLRTPINMLSLEYTVPEKVGNVQNCLAYLHQLDPKISINYSIGEGMEWAMNQWASFDEMTQEIKSDRFLRSYFGDIYVKMNV